jgi:hypothetical protein
MLVGAHEEKRGFVELFACLTARQALPGELLRGVSRRVATWRLDEDYQERERDHLLFQSIPKDSPTRWR